MEEMKLLKSSDAENSGRIFPEVIGFSIFHHPDDKNAIKGFGFDVRHGKDSVRIKFLGDLSQEEGQVVKYMENGEVHSTLHKGRHEMIAAVQEQVSKIAPQIVELFKVIKFTN